MMNNSFELKDGMQVRSMRAMVFDMVSVIFQNKCHQADWNLPHLLSWVSDECFHFNMASEWPKMLFWLYRLYHLYHFIWRSAIGFLVLDSYLASRLETQLNGEELNDYWLPNTWKREVRWLNKENGDGWRDMIGVRVYIHDISLLFQPNWNYCSFRQKLQTNVNEMCCHCISAVAAFSNAGFMQHV